MNGMTNQSRTRKMEVLYILRNNKEIKLTTLYKELYGTDKIIGHTGDAMFFSFLLHLYYARFINIYSKTKASSFEHTFAQYFSASGDRASLGDGYSFIKLSKQYNIYLSITDYFYRVQEAIGFSLTDEISNNRRRWYTESIWGEINHKLRSQVFVIMPFSQNLQPVFDDHIKKVCDRIGYSCTRADNIISSGVVMNEIWSLINNSDIIICDCTGKNPNVFYELGIAHAIGKNVICITQDIDDIPFDTRQIRHIKYSYTPRGMIDFEEKLEQLMAITISDMQNDIE